MNLGKQNDRKREQTEPAAASVDFIRTIASEDLSGESIRLLLKLETKVEVHEVAMQFPHVFNRIAETWKRPLEADRCFDKLLFDDRGTRSGFPAVVIKEIASLRSFYLTHVFPQNADLWEQSVPR